MFPRKAVTPLSFSHDLNFEACDAAPDPRVTTTGGANWTRVNGAGNVEVTSGARIDHKPVGRTNTLKSAIDMAGADWLPDVGTWWTNRNSYDLQTPVRGAKVCKHTRTAVTPGDSVFARCYGLAIPTGTRNGSVYVWVPSGQAGVTSWQMSCDWQDVESGSATSSTVFDAWVRVSSTSFTPIASTRTFLDYRLTLNGNSTYPSTGFVIYTAAPQESDELSEWIPTGAVPVTVYDSIGLLNGPDTTNGVRNAIAAGVVAGSPGTPPTNWPAASSGGTITRTMVGSGVESGIPYVDFRYQFTGVSVAAMNIPFEGPTQIAALPGEQWTTGAYLRLVAGSFANLDAILYINENNAAGVYQTNSTVSILSVSSAPLITQWRSMWRTLTDPDTAFVQTGVYFYNASGAADFTLRIGYPQAVKRAFSTPPVPSAGSALTATSAPSYVQGSAFTQYFTPAGTYLVEFTPRALTHNEVYWGIGQASVFNNSLYLVNSSGRLYLICYSAGVNTMSLDLGALTVGVRHKVAISYQAGQTAARLNGGAEQLSAGALPAVIDVEGLLTSPWAGGSGGVCAHLHRRRHSPVPRRGELYQLTV